MQAGAVIGVRALHRGIIALSLMVIQCIPACAATGIESPPPVHYVGRLDTAGTMPRLAMTLSFRGNDQGRTILELPEKWAGSDALWRSVTDITVTGGTLAAGADAAHRIVSHEPGAMLTVSYHVIDAQPGRPEAISYEKARPAIEPDWFYIHGEGAFITPAGLAGLPATFAWAKAPKGWTLASNLETMARGTLTVNTIAESILIGGRSLRLSKAKVDGAPVRLAMLGSWSFSDAALLGRIARLIQTENESLGAPALPYFVSLAPLTGGSERGRISYGGTGRAAGLALASTDNVSLDDFTRLVAHEYGHRWFGRAFGPVEDGAADYWFSEGVNDWFAASAVARAGYWTPQRWADNLNEVLRRYGTSPARHLSEAEISEQFWTDPDAMQISYDRGHLTALLIDARLGPGQVLKALRLMAHEMLQPDEHEPARFARFLAAAAPDAPVAAARAAVEKALPEGAFDACGKLMLVEQPAYDRGFDLDAAGDRVTAVRSESPAHAAGVRAGMAYVRRLSSSPGDSARPYSAEFSDGSGSRILSWLPQGKNLVQFQQLQMRVPPLPACHALATGG